MIPPQEDSRFVAQMEQVLDVYRRPYDERFPVVCMDESPRQLIDETRAVVPAAPGRPERRDYEYSRSGTCNVFMACEPLAGRRLATIRERKTRIDWAEFLKEIEREYRSAEKITLVMDNLNTHNAASLYEAFAPADAKALWDRFEFVYTPVHGSWLNMAEIELNVLIAQCLNRRIGRIDKMRDQVQAWQNGRNCAEARIDWRFETKDARIKLKRLYPTLQT